MYHQNIHFFIIINAEQIVLNKHLEILNTLIAFLVILHACLALVVAKMNVYSARMDIILIQDFVTNNVKLHAKKIIIYVFIMIMNNAQMNALNVAVN